MLNVAPASTEEPLRCLRTRPHVSARGDWRGRVSPAFPCHQGGLGEGGDSNDFVCTWGELSSNALISGCGEGSQSRSGDAVQTRREAKGTAQPGRDGSSHAQPGPGPGWWVRARALGLSPAPSVCSNHRRAAGSDLAALKRRHTVTQGWRWGGTPENEICPQNPIATNPSRRRELTAPLCYRGSSRPSACPTHSLLKTFFPARM